jgi:hypothetical protein
MKISFLKTLLFLAIFFIGCQTTPNRSLVITDPLQRGQYEFVKNREECWRYAKGVQEQLIERYRNEKSASSASKSSFGLGYLRGVEISQSYDNAFRECMEIKGYQYVWKQESAE